MVARLDLAAGHEAQDRPVGERDLVAADVDRGHDPAEAKLTVRLWRFLFYPRRPVADSQLDLLAEHLQPGVGRRTRVGEDVGARHVDLDAGTVGCVVEPRHGGGEALVPRRLWRARCWSPGFAGRMAPGPEGVLHTHPEIRERCARPGGVVGA